MKLIKKIISIIITVSLSAPWLGVNLSAAENIFDGEFNKVLNERRARQSQNAQRVLTEDAAALKAVFEKMYSKRTEEDLYEFSQAALYNVHKLSEENKESEAKAELTKLLNFVIYGKGLPKNQHTLLGEIYPLAKALKTIMPKQDEDVKNIALGMLPLRGTNTKDFNAGRQLERDFRNDTGTMGKGDCENGTAGVLILSEIKDEESARRLIDYSLENARRSCGIFYAYQTAVVLSERGEAEKLKDFVYRLSLLLPEETYLDSLGNMFSLSYWNRACDNMNSGIFNTVGQYYYDGAPQRAFLTLGDGNTYNFYELLPWIVREHFDDAQTYLLFKYFNDNLSYITPLFVETSYAFASSFSRYQDKQENGFGFCAMEQPRRENISPYKMNEGLLGGIKVYFYSYFKDISAQKDKEIKNKLGRAYQSLSGKNDFTLSYTTSPATYFKMFGKTRTDKLPPPFLRGDLDPAAEFGQAVTQFMNSFYTALEIAAATAGAAAIAKNAWKGASTFWEAAKAVNAGKGGLSTFKTFSKSAGVKEVFANWKNIKYANWQKERLLAKSREAYARLLKSGAVSETGVKTAPAEVPVYGIARPGAADETLALKENILSKLSSSGLLKEKDYLTVLRNIETELAAKPDEVKTAFLANKRNLITKKLNALRSNISFEKNSLIARIEKSQKAIYEQKLREMYKIEGINPADKKQTAQFWDKKLAQVSRLLTEAKAKNGRLRDTPLEEETVDALQNLSLHPDYIPLKAEIDAKMIKALSDLRLVEYASDPTWWNARFAKNPASQEKMKNRLFKNLVANLNKEFGFNVKVQVYDNTPAQWGGEGPTASYTIGSDLITINPCAPDYKDNFIGSINSVMHEYNHAIHKRLVSQMSTLPESFQKAAAFQAKFFDQPYIHGVYSSRVYKLQPEEMDSFLSGDGGSAAFEYFMSVWGDPLKVKGPPAWAK